MSLSNGGAFSEKDVKANMSSRGTMLNPNAAEFVPSSFRPSEGPSVTSESSRHFVSTSSKKQSPDQPEPSVPNSSDEDTHQYWQNQLPDDITPDFTSMGQDNSPGSENFLLTRLSLNDGTGSPIYSLNEKLGSFNSAPYGNNVTLGANGVYSNLTYLQETSPAILVSQPTQWGMPSARVGQQLSNRRDGHQSGEFPNNLVNDPMGASLLCEDGVNPLKLLSVKFPGYSLQSLDDIYQRSGRDLKSAAEFLTLLENKPDGYFNHPRSRSAEPLNTAEPMLHSLNGLAKFGRGAELGPPSRSLSSIIPVDTIPYAGTRDDNTPRDGYQWRYRTGNSVPPSPGSNRIPDNLGGSHVLRSWLELGESTNVFVDSKEETHNLMQLQNSILAQGRQGNLGSNSFVKEPSFKEQMYRMQQRTAQEKTRELYRQRSPFMPASNGYNNQEQQNSLIDLRGLHLGEAMHVLSFELSNRFRMVRSNGRRLQAIIVAGSNAPARLVTAVEQYLFDNGLQFTQPQPGTFSVVIH